MKMISFSAFREKLEDFVDKANEGHGPIVIRRSKGRSLVLMSTADFQAYEETGHLLSTPANARALETSIAEAERGELIQRSLTRCGSQKRRSPT